MQFIQRIWKMALRSEAIRQSIVMTSGNIGTGVIMAVAMIIASRSLGPEKFGVFSVSIAVMSVIARGVDLGLNQLLPRLLNKWHTDTKKQNQFLGQIFRWKLFLITATVIVSLASIPLIQWLLRYPHTSMLVWAVVGVVAMSLFEFVALNLAARHKFFWIAGMNIGQATIKLLGFISIFLLLPGNVETIAGVYYIAPFIAAGILGWYFRDIIFIEPKPASKSIRKEIFKFLGHAGIGVVAMTLIINVDVLLVQRYLDPFETGLYAGATRIAGFVGFITASVGSVLNNRVSRYKDKKTLKKYLFKSLSLAAVALAGYVLFLPFSKLAVLLTIGPEYLGSVFTLNILVLNTFLSLAIVPFVSFFYAVDHPRYFSFGGILQVLIILVGSYLYLPVHGIEAAAWTKVVATIASGIYTSGYLVYAMRKLKDE